MGRWFDPPNSWEALERRFATRASQDLLEHPSTFYSPKERSRKWLSAHSILDEEDAVPIAGMDVFPQIRVDRLAVPMSSWERVWKMMTRLVTEGDDCGLPD